MTDIVLSPKYKYFLKYDDAECEILEGTTAAGKTTIGVVKFMLKVANSLQKDHFIAAKDVGTAERNIINKRLGLCEIFKGYAEYNPRGKGNISTPHITYDTPNGKKIIHIFGYGDKSRWEQLLGGQYGCGYVDEINKAKDMDFVTAVAGRTDYWMGTLNPDDPALWIYKDYINKFRPVEKYKNDAPEELLKCLNEPEEPGWVWWYFDFDDNWGLSEQKKKQIIRSYPVGSVQHKHYVLGLRGKAEGVIFDNFSVKTHTITEAEMLKMVKAKGSEEHFIQYTAGLDTAYSSNSEDTIAMTFMGITNKQRLIYMDELVINNKGSRTPFAPSDVVVKFVEFLEKNRARYGFARDVFIDSADQATLTEAKKYRAKYGCIYNFIPAHKAVQIIDRINLQKGWIALGCYLVCNLCKEHIREMQVYSWSEAANKTVPEDANNHTIDSQCYAWIPYKLKIG